MAEKKYYRLIAAIDFGTTHSGYAYSFKHYYKTDPLKISISTNQDWVSVLTNHVSPKAPTCVLLSPIREFIAFGYEAEDLYWRLSRDENHYDYYFFRDFKMVLHETNVSTTTYREIFASVLFSPISPAGEFKTGRFKCLIMSLFKHKCLGKFRTGRK